MTDTTHDQAMPAHERAMAAMQAAKAIQDQPGDDWITQYSRDHAGVVLARINEAIEHITEAIHLERIDDGEVAIERLEAALACLRNPTAEGPREAAFADACVKANPPRLRNEDA